MTGFVFRIIFKNVQSKMRKFLFQNLSDSCFMLRFRVNLYKFQKFVNQPILIDVNHLLLCLLYNFTMVYCRVFFVDVLLPYYAAFPTLGSITSSTIPSPAAT